MSRQENFSQNGVKTRLFGVVLIIVGSLDCMLSWRGGLELDSSYVLYLGAGVVLYAIGAIRRQQAPADPGGIGGEHAE